jgi:ABC-type sulfate/molybdate transport systems ATPase subunit
MTFSFELAYRIGRRSLASKLESRATRIAITGPSGIGKTTLFRAILGLHPATGAIHLRGSRLDTLAPEHRGIGWAPQESALFPHLDVYGNLAFASTEKPIDRIAALVGVESLLGRSARDLSGGERQRIALGRALGKKPRLLVLDEPFSALDRDARRALGAKLEEERARLDAIVLVASHDEADVSMLADEVYAMRDDGALISTGAPP